MCFSGSLTVGLLDFIGGRGGWDGEDFVGIDGWFVEVNGVGRLELKESEEEGGMSFAYDLHFVGGLDVRCFDHRCCCLALFGCSPWIVFLGEIPQNSLPPPLIHHPSKRHRRQ